MFGGTISGASNNSLEAEASSSLLHDELLGITKHLQAVKSNSLAGIEYGKKEQRDPKQCFMHLLH